MMGALVTRPVSAAAAANAPARNRYMVRYIRGGVVEAQFEALAVDSLACATDHAGGADGAKVDVMTIAAFEDKCRAEREFRRNFDTTINALVRDGMLRP